MVMEKRASTGETSVAGLIKQAEDHEAVIVGKYDLLNHGKKAMVLVATGPRATELEELLKRAGVI